MNRTRLYDQIMMSRYSRIAAAELLRYMKEDMDQDILSNTQKSLAEHVLVDHIKYGGVMKASKAVTKIFELRLEIDRDLPRGLRFEYLARLTPGEIFFAVAVTTFVSGIWILGFIEQPNQIGPITLTMATISGLISWMGMSSLSLSFGRPNNYNPVYLRSNLGESR